MMEGGGRGGGGWYEEWFVLHLSLLIDVCTVVFTSLSVSTGGGESTTIPNCFWRQQVARRSSTPPTRGNTCFTFYFNMCLLDACASSLHIAHTQIKVTMIDWELLNGPRNDWLLFVWMPSNLTIIRGVLTAYLLGLSWYKNFTCQ